MLETLYFGNISSITAFKKQELVYVNSSLYLSIQPELEQYRCDIYAQNYSVDIIQWSDANVTALQNDLIAAYNTSRGDLEGVVLIRTLPSGSLEYYDDTWNVFFCN